MRDARYGMRDAGYEMGGWRINKDIIRHSPFAFLEGSERLSPSGFSRAEGLC